MTLANRTLFGAQRSISAAIASFALDRFDEISPFLIFFRGAPGQVSKKPVAQEIPSAERMHSADVSLRGTARLLVPEN